MPRDHFKSDRHAALDAVYPGKRYCACSRAAPPTADAPTVKTRRASVRGLRSCSLLWLLFLTSTSHEKLYLVLCQASVQLC